jgi:hypothetical protein
MSVAGRCPGSVPDVGPARHAPHPESRGGRAQRAVRQRGGARVARRLDPPAPARRRHRPDAAPQRPHRRAAPHRHPVVRGDGECHGPGAHAHSPAERHCRGDDHQRPARRPEDGSREGRGQGEGQWPAAPGARRQAVTHSDRPDPVAVIAAADHVVAAGTPAAHLRDSRPGHAGLRQVERLAVPGRPHQSDPPRKRAARSAPGTRTRRA